MKQRALWSWAITAALGAHVAVLAVRLPEPPEAHAAPRLAVRLAAPSAKSEIREIRNPKVSSETKPKIRNPEVSSETKPEIRNPKVSSETKPEIRNPKVSSETKPEIRDPKVSSETKPEIRNPRASETKPETRNPKVSSEAKPEIRNPRAAEGPSSAEVDLRAYRRAIQAAVLAERRYPRAARRRGWQGLAMVRVRVGVDGRLIGAPEILRQSGHEILDREVVRMVKAAAPLPGFPAGLRQADLAIEIPVRFQLHR